MFSFVHILLGDAFTGTFGLMILLAADILAVLSVPSVLLRRSGRPLAAMSWLLALFVLPYIGVVWWWAIGHEHLKRTRRRRRASSEAFSESLREQNVSDVRPGEDAYAELAQVLPRGLIDASEEVAIGGPSRANEVELLVDGGTAYPRIEALIEGAERYVHLLFYIWENDDTGRRIRDLLVAAARRGVEVRVLVDAIGSPDFASDLAEALTDAGASVGTFLPPTAITRRPRFNFRNHRKLIVVDGSEAFFGGMNIGHEYEREWHDLGIYVCGPVVRDLHAVFLDDWYFATDENLADEEYLRRESGDEENGSSGRQRELDGAREAATCAVVAAGPDTRYNVLKDAFLHAINGARVRLWLTTPYFIPGGEIVAALRSAVQRGVDVRLLLPVESDVPIVRRAARCYYPMLLESGIRLFEYQPRILHAKALIIDEAFAMVGSANLDVRSFKLNFELAGVFASPELNRQLAELFVADLEQSEEVSLDSVDKLPLLTRIADSLAHLTSPLL